MGKVNIGVLALLITGCSSDAVGDKPPVEVLDMGGDVVDAGEDLALTDDGPVLTPGGVSVTPTTVQVVETGGMAAVSVVLDSEPVSDVTVTFATSDTLRLEVPRPLVFGPTNWDMPQMAVFTGKPDNSFSGNHTVEVTITALGEANYADVEPVTVRVDVLDDEHAGVSVLPLSLSVSEGVVGQSFDVRLSLPPTAPVTIPVSVSDDTQLMVDVTELVFTVDDYDIPKPVLVTAIDDADLEEEQEHSVLLGEAVGGGYSGLDPLDVDVTVVSDDVPVFTVTPTMLVTNEVGTTQTFEVSLTPAPPEPVTVSATVTDPTEGSLLPASVMFEPMNPGPHTFRITGRADGLCDGPQTYEVTFEVATAAFGYDTATVPPVQVRNVDVDGCGAAVTPQTLTLPEGMSGTFSIALDVPPGEVVTIDLTPSTPDVTVMPTQLLFDDTNFGTQQQVTVMAVDNAVVDGDRPVSIATDLTATGAYANVDPANVSVLVVDDD